MKSPSFLLLILSCGILLSSCKKGGNAVAIVPDYTANMGGVRIWHGEKIDYGLGTVSYFTDTFAVTITSDSTIVIPINFFYEIDTINYVSSGLATNTDSFYKWYNTLASTYPAFVCVVYNYANNSIEYTGFWPDANGGLSITLNTP